MTLDREAASRLVLAQAAAIPTARVQLSKDALFPGDLALALGVLRTGPHYLGSWVAFADLDVGATFAHPCQYWFLDLVGGPIRVSHEQWFPDKSEDFALLREPSEP